MNTFRKLMGVILTYHQQWWKCIKSPTNKTIANKTLIELSPGLNEYDASIIWRNTHAEVSIPSNTVKAFINYQKNLNNL